MAALPYRLYGGATRPDALNFNPGFSDALAALYAAAPPDVQRELGLNSGYRSRAVQEKLFNASDKTGHSVARPGHSKHESGSAADLYGFGLSGGPSVSDATKAWVKANADKHGLYFPMSYEPWHIQLRDGATPSTGVDGGGGSGVGQVMASAVDPTAMAMAMMEGQDNPWKAITDAASKRGGLVGEGSAGTATAAPADPGIPPLETANLRLTPDTLGSQATPQMPGPQLAGLANLFQVKQIGQAAGLVPPENPRRF
jgi:D-alanyl-D-alanine carboxypeptidase